MEPNHPEVAAAVSQVILRISDLSGSHRCHLNTVDLQVRAQLEFAASEEAGAGAGAVGGEGAGAASSEHAYLAPPLPLAAYNA